MGTFRDSESLEQLLHVLRVLLHEKLDAHDERFERVVISVRDLVHLVLEVCVAHTAPPILVQELNETRHHLLARARADSQQRLAHIVRTHGPIVVRIELNESLV